LCNRGPERIGLQVVRETPSAVDLDDRDPLAILRFERLVAADVDLAEIELELALELPQLCDRAVAQVTALRVVDRDVGPTDRCRA
jgi:hypothetical protein